MKKSALLCALLLAISILIKGQSDPAATKVLDSFSSKALAAPSVTMKFNLVTIDQIENSTSTIEGSIVLDKDKYKLLLPDNTTWFNGASSWNYLIKEKEVTITKPGTDEETFLSKPSSIFTIYKKGYKTRLISENTTQYEVDLYPEDLKSDLVRIRLTITKPGMDLKNVEYKTKEGLIITLNVTEYNLKSKYDQSFFIFDKSNYIGVEIIDLR